MSSLHPCFKTGTSRTSVDPSLYIFLNLYLPRNKPLMSKTMFLIFLGGTYLEKGKSLSAMSIWTSTNHNQGESWLVGWQRGVGMEKVWIGEPALEFCIHLYNSIFHYVPLYLRFCAIIFVQLYKCTSANVKTLIYIYTHPIATTTTTIIIITSLLYQLTGGQDAKGETKNNFIRDW